MPKSQVPINLIDIRTIEINNNLSKREKINAYIRQIKTPHYYKCGKFTITERHPATGPTIEDCLKGMMA